MADSRKTTTNRVKKDNPDAPRRLLANRISRSLRSHGLPVSRMTKDSVRSQPYRTTGFVVTQAGRTVEISLISGRNMPLSRASTERLFAQMIGVLRRQGISRFKTEGTVLKVMYA